MVLLLRVALGQQEVENQLFAPLDDALNDVETKHTQTVQDVDTFIEESWFNTSLSFLNLHKNLAELVNLGKAGFARDNSPNRALNRRLLLLQVLNFFNKDWRILLRG